MFGKKISDLNWENVELKNKIIELENKNKILSKQCDEYIDVLKEQNQFSCENLFDFNNPALIVFAIERNQDSYNRWRTIVGYLIKDDGDCEVQEWSMATTINQHKKLVEEFRNSRG